MTIKTLTPHDQIAIKHKRTHFQKVRQDIINQAKNVVKTTGREHEIAIAKMTLAQKIGRQTLERNRRISPYLKESWQALERTTRLPLKEDLHD